MILPAGPRSRLALLTLALCGGCGSTTEVLEREDGTGGGGGGDDVTGAAQGGGVTATGTTTGGGCTSDAQCIEDNGGLPYLCRAGGCASTLTEDCSRFIGDLTALAEGRAITVGALVPLTGGESAVGADQADAIELAVDELDASGGLPRAGGDRASVVVVVCDEVADAARATAHLVDDLGVPLVLGPADGDRALVLAGAGTPRRAMVLSPSGDHPALPSVADEGLVWQAASVAEHGDAMALVAARLEDGLEPPVRAAIVTGTDARSGAVGERLLATLRLNGVDSAANVESGALQVLVIVDGADPSAPAADIVAFEPALVFLAVPAPAALVEAVEGASDVPPTWIAAPSPAGAEALGASLAGRFFAVEVGPPADHETADVMSIRFASAYGRSPSFRGVEAYDAAYVAFGALSAAGGEPADGAAVALGATKLLPPGVAVSVGPADLQVMLSALAAGQAVDLGGATGSLDADPVSGSFPRSHHVLCAPGGELQESGLLVDEEGALTGTSTCL